MEYLPLELHNKIFDLLSIRDMCSLSELNQHWNRVASERLYRYPTLKNERALKLFTLITKQSQTYIQILDLSIVHQFITDNTLLPLSNHVTQLRHLDLSKSSRVSPCIILQFIQNNLNNLNTLLLANCTLSMDILKCIGKANHRRLKYLDLSNTMIKPCTSIDSSNHLDTMIISPTSLSQLIHLDLSYCGWVNHQTIENIANGLPQLEHIILQWCNQVKPTSIHIMVKRLVRLTCVDVRHIDSIENTDQVRNIVCHSNSLKKVLFTCKRINAQIML